MRMTLKQAMTFVNEAVVKEGADKTVSVQDCRYFAEANPDKPKAKRAPSCLVGHVLYRAGIRFSDLNRPSGADDDDLNTHSFAADALHIRLKDAGLTFTPGAMSYLCNLQYLQDDGVEWGICQAKALDEK